MFKVLKEQYGLVQESYISVMVPSSWHLVLQGLSNLWSLHTLVVTGLSLRTSGPWLNFDAWVSKSLGIKA
jgi:hypothetical protein